uniref:Cytochrome P450 n=1 Tax=Heterorhabditis bacteriophora TaxID=37862 RepID=A0A1I7WS40_HETBA
MASELADIRRQLTTGQLHFQQMLEMQTADVFMEDGVTLDDRQKTRLQVSRLDAPTHIRFTRYILSKTPADLNWEETMTILGYLFGLKKTLF